LLGLAICGLISVEEHIPFALAACLSQLSIILSPFSSLIVFGWTDLGVGSLGGPVCRPIGAEEHIPFALAACFSQFATVCSPSQGLIGFG